MVPAMRWRLLVLVGAALCGVTATAEGANRYVCAAGVNCDAGSPHGAGTSYATIALAETAAVCGDNIFLEAGETFAASTTVDRTDCASNRIIIRSDAADSNFPAAGVRLVPTSRMDGTVPIGGNTNPAMLATVVGSDTSTNSRAFQTGVGARGYTFKFLRFISNTTTNGFNEMIRLGDNAAGVQEKEADQPQDITIDRCLFEGNHLIGQKVGVGLHGKNLRVENSYFTNIAGLGQDATCFSAGNGTGPVDLVNNYCEGAGYGFMFGGSDPQMRTNVNTKAGSTTTTIELDAATFRAGHTIATLAVGQFVSITTAAATTAEHTYVATIVDADTFTVSPALTTAPATGLEVLWGEVYDDIAIERNHFIHPTKWRNAIIPAPANVAAVSSNTAGTLAAGTYHYVVVARYDEGYQNNSIYSPPSQQVSCTLDATGQCVVSWTAVTGASHYRVFGRSAGAQDRYFQVTAPTVTYTDTGTAGTLGTTATAGGGSNGSRWVVKNLGEIKQGTRIDIRYNIFENNWFGQGGGGAGLGVWLKSSVNGPNARFFQTKTVNFSYNVIRHVAGCILTTSQEEAQTGIYARPGPLEDLTIEHNLCYDSSSANGGNYHAVTTGFTGGKNLTIRNNTFLHTSGGALSLDGAALQGTTTIKDNIIIHNTYGFKGTGFNSGNSSLDNWFPSLSFLNNVLTDSAYTYPATTIEPSRATLEAAFVNFGGPAIADYDLLAGHAYRTASSTAGRVGADIPTLITFVAGVESGTASGAPVWLTTSPLLSGTIGVAYTATVAATGGTGGKTYSLIGSLPPGLSLAGATGVISGTPTGSGASHTFTLRATDQAAAASDRSFTITINAAGGAVTITTTSVPDTDANVPYSAPINVTGGTGTFTWSISGGTLPPGIVLGTTTGILSGTATMAGNYNFTVRADSGANFDTQGLSIRVSHVGPVGPSPTPPPRPKPWNGQEIATFASDDLPVVDPDNPRHSVQAKDIWVGPNNTPYVITATSPTVTTAGIGAHLIIPFSSMGDANNTAGDVTASANGIIDTPAGGKEYGGAGMRYPVDLSRGYSQFRFSGFVTNATATAGAALRVEYSADCSTGWAELAATSGQATLPTTAISTNTVKSAFVDIVAAAKADVCLRLWHTTGDGADDVAFRLLAVEVK